MLQRGKKSAASRAAVATLAAVEGFPTEAQKRAPPPADFTDEQAVEWRAVVNAQPPNWFTRDTHGLLTQYCRHVVESRHISVMLAAVAAKAKRKPADMNLLKAYERLLQMHAREGRAVSELAHKMRLSQLSRHHPAFAKPKNDASDTRPWNE